jgi:hypothetical protein
MSKKKIVILIMVILILILAFLAIYFLWIKKSDSTSINISGKLKGGGYRILYQKGSHEVTSSKRAGTECYNLNFREYLDGGIIKTDSSDNKILDLKDYPMSLLTSQKYSDYYYISAVTSPVKELYGFSFTDWDIPDQTLYSAGFNNGGAKEIKKGANGKFPGGVLTSPDNQYLIYLMTIKTEMVTAPTTGFVSSKLNAYTFDSDLIIRNIKNGEEKTVLSDNYNRQLFTSFADFSEDGKYFYTIARVGDSFEFVKITLDSGKVMNFSEVLPSFDWNKVNWESFFKKSGDLAHASFFISPDESRMIAYKNTTVSTTNVNSCFTTANHKLWIFKIKDNILDEREEKDYAVHATWKNNSKEFAIAILTAAGCYPDYMNARIDKMDKDGKNKETLVTEIKSKITRIGWSPKGDDIAYDIYGVDFIGRIKTVDVNDKSTKEIINTQTTEGSINIKNPVLLHFAGWVPE